MEETLKEILAEIKLQRSPFHEQTLIEHNRLDSGDQMGQDQTALATMGSLTTTKDMPVQASYISGLLSQESDGTRPQYHPLKVESDASPNLRVSLYDGNTKLKPDEIDPYAYTGGFQIPYSITKRTNPVFKTLSGRVTGTGTEATLHDNLDFSDYEVPAGKEFVATKLQFMSSVASAQFAFLFGSTGVGDGDTLPNSPVFILGTGDNGPFIATSADTLYEFDIHFIVPAGKFPAVNTSTDSGAKQCTVYGVEWDA